MSKIEVHADDYGLSAHASEDILKGIRAGKLDGISVLTNMSCLPDCAEKFKTAKGEWEKQLSLTVHLNFMEGHSVAEPGRLPDFVDKNGYFRIGWGNLFLWNYCPWKYRAIKEQLKTEIKAQTERFKGYFGMDYGMGTPLRFDGHQHTQMIPIVYRALLEVIKEEEYLTEYIRVTKEPIIPFFKNISLWKTYSTINWIKNILLNIYSCSLDRQIKRNGIKMTPMFLWGVLLSGRMDEKRVKTLFPAMKLLADKRGRDLEVLFHPGTTVETEMGAEFSSLGNRGFYLSEGREIEYQALMNWDTEYLH